ncbi:MAG: hypothetical protein HY526_03820 [Betaproteobacteria bacterium]|nr:hypothetical protein [Betaproteobacteria bacterium]
MAFKILASIVAIGLMVVYNGAVVVKLKDIALGVVVLIGLVMMLWDLWESVRQEDE